MAKTSRDNGRLRILIMHLISYFVVSAVAFVINVTTDRETAWFVLPMVGWGSVLALHVAYVMGLFDVFFNKERRD